MDMLFAYCVPDRKPAIKKVLGMVFMAVCIIAVTLSGNIPDEEGGKIGGFAGALVFFLLAFLFYYMEWLGQYTRFKKRMEYFREKCWDILVCQDFQISVPQFDDQLRVGRECLFGRNKGLVVFYNEISEIIRHEVNVNYTSGRRETTRKIEIIAGGTKYELCNLNKRHDTEWRQFVDFIKLKAPNIKIDYNMQVSNLERDDSNLDDD